MEKVQRDGSPQAIRRQHDELVSGGDAALPDLRLRRHTLGLQYTIPNGPERGSSADKSVFCPETSVGAASSLSLRKRQADDKQRSGGGGGGRRRAAHGSNSGQLPGNSEHTSHAPHAVEVNGATGTSNAGGLIRAIGLGGYRHSSRVHRHGMLCSSWSTLLPMRKSTTSVGESPTDVYLVVIGQRHCSAAMLH